MQLLLSTFGGQYKRKDAFRTECRVQGIVQLGKGRGQADAFWKTLFAVLPEVKCIAKLDPEMGWLKNLLIATWVYGHAHMCCWCVCLCLFVFEFVFVCLCFICICLFVCSPRSFTRHS